MGVYQNRLSRVIGHRGAKGHAPENTLASFRAARKLGVDWVEFDVQLSADRELAVFHDDTLERTTDGEGAVLETRWADLQALDTGSWFAPEFAGEKIPSLDQALGELAALGLGANVEIKPADGTEAEAGALIARHLVAHWPQGLPAPLVSSFKVPALVAARDAAPAQDRAFLFLDVPDGWIETARTLDCSAVHCVARVIDEDLVRAAHDAGLAIRTFTVNDVAEAKRVFGAGVDGIFSDFPDRMMDL